MMKKYLLLVISAILLVLVLLAMPGKDSFQMGAGDIMEIIDSSQYIIPADQLEGVMEKDHIVLVDLNSREEYNATALPGALSLPLKELSIETIHEVLSVTETYVLYSADLSTSCSAWILLTQMGYKNIFVLDTN